MLQISTAALFRRYAVKNTTLQRYIDKNIFIRIITINYVVLVYSNILNIILIHRNWNLYDLFRNYWERYTTPWRKSSATIKDSISYERVYRRRHGDSRAIFSTVSYTHLTLPTKA